MRRPPRGHEHEEEADPPPAWDDLMGSVPQAVTFDVAGIPVPQGALVRSPSGGLYNRGARNLDAWRHAIATEARAARWHEDLLDGPVTVRVTFRLPCPQGHVGSRGLRPSAPRHPSTRPDLDKLARAVLDALTGVVFADDAQVAELIATKVYAAQGRQPGAEVEVARR